MVLAVAAPAFAQTFQYQFQSKDVDFGDVTNEGSGGFSVSGDGNTSEDRGRFAAYCGCQPGEHR